MGTLGASTQTLPTNAQKHEICGLFNASWYSSMGALGWGRITGKEAYQGSMRTARDGDVESSAQGEGLKWVAPMWGRRVFEEIARGSLFFSPRF